MTERKMLISPSILSADMARLADEVESIAAAGADLVHVDVMDGRFVPNITIGIPVVAALKKVSRLPLDVHLMILEPERYVGDFAKAGADIISVQVEATCHLQRTLVAIREAGAKSGVVLNPSTPLSMIEHVLVDVDMVVIMTVEPGFGGQSFLPSMLPKLRDLTRILRDRKLPVDIQVDGGINKETIARVAEAGANVFVSGTGVFGTGDVATAISSLRSELQKAVGSAK